MDTNIQSYAKIYKNCLDEDICKKIIKQIDIDRTWGQHTYFDPAKNIHIPLNKDKEFEVFWGDFEMRDYLMGKIWDALKQYVDDLNFSWMNGWSAFSSVRFNRYKENTLMSNHADHIHSLFDGEKKGIPVLSVLGLLNNDYEGGELIMFEDTEININTGDIMVFPSNFLYPHKVNPVTKGTRYSYVSWAW